MVSVQNMSEKLSKKLENKKMKGGTKMQKTVVLNLKNEIMPKALTMVTIMMEMLLFGMQLDSINKAIFKFIMMELGSVITIKIKRIHGKIDKVLINLHFIID